MSLGFEPLCTRLQNASPIYRGGRGENPAQTVLGDRPRCATSSCRPFFTCFDQPSSLLKSMHARTVPSHCTVSGVMRSPEADKRTPRSHHVKQSRRRRSRHEKASRVKNEVLFSYAALTLGYDWWAAHSCTNSNYIAFRCRKRRDRRGSQDLGNGY